MLHTLISYLSRFSRLVLLTFAFVVVLILILFTVNSASDNDSGTANETVTSSSQESQTTTEQSYTYDESTNEAPGSQSLVIINSGSASTSTDTTTGNPQSFTANAIDLDSGDTITIVTTDAGTQAALEAELASGHVSSTSTTLPATGLGSTVAAVIGLMALSAVFVSYARSRKNLSYELLEINR